MMENKSLLIYGNITQRRDFTLVRDVVDANIMTMTPNINFGIFNAGTGIGTTFTNFVSLINKFLGTSIKPRFIENPLENYVHDIITDLAQMSRSLGFRPKWNS